MEMQPNQVYEFGVFRLMPQERRLYRVEDPIGLPPKEFDLLYFFVRNAGQPLTREELHKELWPDTVVEEANLNVHVSALRKVLSDGAGDQQFIETLPRRGYRFIAPVGVTSFPPAGAKVAEPALPLEETQPQARTDGFRRAVDFWGYLLRRPGLSAGFAGLLILALSAGGYFYFARISTAEGTANKRAWLEAVPVTTYPGRETQPAFSPDGNQFAFVWRRENESNLDIYIRLVDDSNTLQLTNHPGDDVSPAWAPHGRAVAFYRSTNEGDGIYIVPSLGGAERKLTDVWGNRFGFGSHTWLHWSPRGTGLVISDKSSQNDPFSLYLLSPENGERQRLTTPPMSVVGDCSPVFSPDGNRIAFVRVVSAVVGEIFIMDAQMDAQGGTPRQLTRNGEGISSMTWMANGKELVYSTRYNGKSSLFRIAVDTGHREAIPTIGNDAQYPAFARQGNRLLWARNTDNTDIFRAKLKSDAHVAGAPVNLISSTAVETSPRYSPDGNRIAFVSNRSGADEIWVSDREGKNPIRLTSFRGPLPGSPAWSPDGKQIVFDCRPDGNADLYAVSSEGGAPRRLTTDAAEDMVPYWSRDGRWIYFTSQRSGSLQVWKIPANGGDAVQVTQQGGFDPIESPDGQWLYFTRDRGSSAIWRMPVAGGAESFIVDYNQKNYSRLWTVTPQGILFAVPSPPTRTELNFFDLSAGAIRPLAVFDCTLRNGVSGLSLSSNGEALLFPVITQRGSDLMMIENFH